MLYNTFSVTYLIICVPGYFNEDPVVVDIIIRGCLEIGYLFDKGCYDIATTVIGEKYTEGNALQWIEAEANMCGEGMCNTGTRDEVCPDTTN